MERVFEPATDSKEIRDLINSCASLWNSSKIIHYDEKACVISADSSIRWIHEHDFKGKNLLIRNIALDHLTSMEQQAPGSSPLFFPVLTEKIQITEECNRCNTDFALKNASRFLSHRGLEIISTLRETLSSTARIILKPGNFKTDVIEFKSGYKFPIGLDRTFHKSIGGGICHIENAKVIAIEGSPSSVGEINSLLQKAHDLKWNVILLARSFPEEIIATLSANWMRNTLSILPVVYGTELHNINSIVDFATVARYVPISSDLGDSIASAIIDEEKYGFVDICKIDDWEMLVETEKPIDQSHIKNLIKKMNTSNSPAEQDLISQRIASLSSELIEINLHSPDNVFFEKIDYSLKTYREFIKTGFLNTSLGPQPVSHYQAAKKHAEAFKNNIKSIGGFLICHN
ncbi:MAG: hypothetical protein CBC29_05935 [Methylococcaceae bacterium TMED69]|nr:MAG: hypothetical protein CBC29_05935 [Methylococcaceae bacterium TMED69]|tara:strand:- start:375 stop:1580 length:1206 start_codon:yes stop_codon:yes gene_type:complete